MPVGVGRPEREAFFLEGLDRQPDAFVADEHVRTGKDFLTSFCDFPQKEQCTSSGAVFCDLCLHIPVLTSLNGR